MEVLYSLRLPVSMKALPFFPNYTTSCLAAPDSDLGTTIAWNMSTEHRGAYHHHAVMKKLKDTKQSIVLEEANDEIPPKPKEKVAWRF